MEQAREDAGHIESAVKTVLRFRQVEEPVLIEIEGVVGAPGGGLYLLGLMES
jgi:hypothetical protein